VLGVVFLHEKMTPSMLLGSFLILVSILAPAVIADRAARKEAAKSIGEGPDADKSESL
jgi:hypothetical protein